MENRGVRRKFVPIIGTFVFVATILFVSLAPATASASDWGTQFRISNPALRDFGATEGEVVADDAGNFTYVWEQRLSATQNAIRSRVARNDGTLSAIRDVAVPDANGGTPDAPAISVGDDGVVRVVWFNDYGLCLTVCPNRQEVKYVTLDSEGRPDGAPLTLASTPYLSGDLSSDLTLDTGAGGDSLAAWIFDDNSESTTSVQAARIPSAGSPSPPAEIDSGAEGDITFDDVTVSTAAGGGGFVGWSAGAVVRGRMIRPDGQRTPIQVLSQTADTFDVVNSVIDSQGKATAGFTVETANPTQVYARQMTPGGEVLGLGPINISASDGFAYLSSNGGIALSDANRVTFAYYQLDDVCCVAVTYVRTLSADGVLGSIEPISPPASSSYEAAVAYGPNGGVAIHDIEPIGENDRVIATDLTAQGVPTGPETVLDNTPQFDYPTLAQPAIAGNGDVAALWALTIDDEDADEMRTAIADESGPELTLWAPPKATAGQEVVVAANGVDRSPISYSWTFGDGGTDAGPVAEHTFADAGTYEIAVTATSESGRSAAATASIEVLPKGVDPPVPPDTRITARPAKRTKKRAATFRFISSLGGSRFECRLDRAGWRSCRAPRKLKRLRPGKHAFKVRAIKGDLIDRTPASYGWTVKKAKRPKRR